MDRRYNPTRWVCERSRDKCDGTFGVKGKCRIAHKCLDMDYKRTPYEFTYGKRKCGRNTGMGDPVRALNHISLGGMYRRLFDKENWLAYHTEYRENNRELINRRHREKYNPGLTTLDPDYIPRNRIKSSAPPCGGDHANCPYDACRYESWDEEQYNAKNSAAKLAAKTRYLAKRKERMATDPEYAERERAKAREGNRRYRERRKDLMKSLKENAK